MPLVRPARFDEWLNIYFAPYDNVASPWDRYPPGGDEQFPEFSGTDDEIVDLFTHTMLASGTELLKFSDAQVGNGLKLLFDNSLSNLVLTVRDGAAGTERKIEALRSIKTLCSDCLTPRAPTVLGHLNEASTCQPLGFITYMLWDVTPLSHWPGKKHGQTMYPIIVEVMETALYSSNCAAVESGLHGLGHTVYKCEELAAAAIDKFVKTRRGHVREELIAYAVQARTGMIQ